LTSLTTVNEIEKIILPVIENSGMELVDIEWGPKNGSWNLCVYIDKEEGIYIDDCELISREVSDLLDMADIISHRYTLEVSSPGLERPLKKREDFQRFRDNPIKVKTLEALDGQRKFRGLLLGINEEDKIILENENGTETEIPLAGVAKANLWFQPDFKKVPKGGIKEK
jgi:ribosome maturation factor RimP